MKQDRTQEADGFTWGAEAAHEDRAGLSGFGGRPSLHPSWSELHHAQTQGLINGAAKAPSIPADPVSPKKSANS